VELDRRPVYTARGAEESAREKVVEKRARKRRGAVRRGKESGRKEQWAGGAKQRPAGMPKRTAAGSPAAGRDAPEKKGAGRSRKPGAGLNREAMRPMVAGGGFYCNGGLPPADRGEPVI